MIGPWRERMLGGLAVAVVALAADQLSKQAILARLEPLPLDARLITLAPILDLRLTANHGITFGVFNDGGSLNTAIFSALAVAIITVLVWSLRKARSRWVAAAIGMVIGGAIGNLIDRLQRGAVTDFIDVHLGEHHWYIFNLGDAAICIGVAIMLLDGLLIGPESPTASPPMDQGSV